MYECILYINWFFSVARITTTLSHLLTDSHSSPLFVLGCHVPKSEAEIQTKFMPTAWRVFLKGKYEGWSWHLKAHHGENTSMDNYYNLWLNPQAGKMKWILHSDWLPKSCIGPTMKSSLFGHILNPLLTKLVWSRWLNSVLVRCIFIDWDKWKHIKELGQYLASLTSLLVDNAYLFSATTNCVK